MACPLPGVNGGRAALRRREEYGLPGEGAGIGGAAAGGGRVEQPLVDRKIFVGGFGFVVKAKHLIEKFSSFGKVERAWVVFKDRKSACFGYVIFSPAKGTRGRVSARNARRQMNGKMFMGQRIQVVESTYVPQPSRAYRQKKRSSATSLSNPVVELDRAKSLKSIERCSRQFQNFLFATIPATGSTRARRFRQRTSILGR